MKPPHLEHIARLRASVGYLGEREQYAWWQCSFFSPQSHAFLAPVFGLILPLCCYYLDVIDHDKSYTLGFICEGRKE